MGRQEHPPNITDDQREDHLISLAFDEAQRQLETQSASSQTLTFLLKEGSRRGSLERQELERRIALQSAKIEAMEAGGRIEELYGQAIDAMKIYQGQDPEGDVDPYGF